MCLRMCDNGPVLFVCITCQLTSVIMIVLRIVLFFCAKITANFTESDAVQLVVAGDFNNQVRSRFFESFQNLAVDNNLCVSDVNRLTNILRNIMMLVQPFLRLIMYDALEMPTFWWKACKL
jgi:hypothetical protein